MRLPADAAHQDPVETGSIKEPAQGDPSAEELEDDAEKERKMSLYEKGLEPE